MLTVNFEDGIQINRTKADLYLTSQSIYEFGWKWALGWCKVRRVISKVGLYTRLHMHQTVMWGGG